MITTWSLTFNHIIGSKMEVKIEVKIEVTFKLLNF